jgi:hypothetical protein
VTVTVTATPSKRGIKINKPLKRGIKAKFPFLEGVDAAFCAADGVVILKFAFSKLKIQFKGKSKATTPSVTTPRLRQRTSHPPLSRGEFYYINPSKRGIKINRPLNTGILLY